MSELIYTLLEKLGYDHPLHPVLVHLPIGLILGAFALALGGRLWRKQALNQSAYHALVIASLFSLVAIFMGFMDWQRYFHGMPMPSILAKMLLSLIFVTVTGVGIWWGQRRGTGSGWLLAVYATGSVCVMALGYLGGDLTFSGRTPPVLAGTVAGRQLYEAYCSSCHADGGNLLVPGKPLRAAAQIASLEDFRGYLRDPSGRQGNASGLMPAFTAEQLSDKDVAVLFGYISAAVAKAPCPENVDQVQKITSGRKD